MVDLSFFLEGGGEGVFLCVYLFLYEKEELLEIRGQPSTCANTHTPLYYAL